MPEEGVRQRTSSDAGNSGDACKTVADIQPGNYEELFPNRLVWHFLNNWKVSLPAILNIFGWNAFDSLYGHSI